MRFDDFGVKRKSQSRFYPFLDCDFNRRDDGGVYPTNSVLIFSTNFIFASSELCSGVLSVVFPGVLSLQLAAYLSYLCLSMNASIASCTSFLSSMRVFQEGVEGFFGRVILKSVTVLLDISYDC